MRILDFKRVSNIIRWLLMPSRFLPEAIKQIFRPLYLSLFWYEKRELFKIYSNFISYGDLVFDVGANNGYMTGIFLSLGAKVICIEPQPKCIEILKRRFGNKEDVTIVKKGLSDKQGRLIFYINEKYPEISSFSKIWKNKGFNKLGDWNRKLQVSVTTLDALIKKFGIPKFIKIDVEGFEIKVLRGLNSKVPFISFEFTKKYLKDAKLCIKHISRLGKAKFNFSIHKDFGQLRYVKWMSSKELIEKLENLKENDKYLSGDIYVKMG